MLLMYPEDDTFRKEGNTSEIKIVKDEPATNYA